MTVAIRLVELHKTGLYNSAYGSICNKKPMCFCVHAQPQKKYTRHFLSFLHCSPNHLYGQVKQVQGRMDQMDTDYSRMKEISRAGGGLFKFVKAVLGYCSVAREIKPKREKVCDVYSNWCLLCCECWGCHLLLQ